MRLRSVVGDGLPHPTRGRTPSNSPALSSLRSRSCLAPGRVRWGWAPDLSGGRYGDLKPHLDLIDLKKKDRDLQGAQKRTKNTQRVLLLRSISSFSSSPFALLFSLCGGGVFWPPHKEKSRGKGPKLTKEIERKLFLSLIFAV